jgi:hypothetical protein
MTRDRFNSALHDIHITLEAAKGLSARMLSGGSDKELVRSRMMQKLGDAARKLEELRKAVGEDIDL